MQESLDSRAVVSTPQLRNSFEQQFSIEKKFDVKIGTHHLKIYTHNEYHQVYAATMYNGWQRRWNQTLSPRIVISSRKLLKRP